MLPEDAVARLMSEPPTNAAVTFSWEMARVGELSNFIEETAADYDQLYEGGRKGHPLISRC